MQSWYANTTNPDWMGDGKSGLVVLVHWRAFNRRLLNRKQAQSTSTILPDFEGWMGRWREGDVQIQLSKKMERQHWWPSNYRVPYLGIENDFVGEFFGTRVGMSVAHARPKNRIASAGSFIPGYQIGV